MPPLPHSQPLSPPSWHAPGSITHGLGNWPLLSALLAHRAVLLLLLLLLLLPLLLFSLKESNSSFRCRPETGWHVGTTDLGGVQQHLWHVSCMPLHSLLMARSLPVM